MCVQFTSYLNMQLINATRNYSNKTMKQLTDYSVQSVIEFFNHTISFSNKY